MISSIEWCYCVVLVAVVVERNEGPCFNGFHSLFTCFYFPWSVNLLVVTGILLIIEENNGFQESCIAVVV